MIFEPISTRHYIKGSLLIEHPSHLLTNPSQLVTHLNLLHPPLPRHLERLQLIMITTDILIRANGMDEPIFVVLGLISSMSPYIAPRKT